MLIRQHFRLRRSTVTKLREMSWRQRVSTDALVRRAIESYTPHGGSFFSLAEQKAVCAFLAQIHNQVCSAIACIDEHLAGMRERERALRDPAFRARIREETALWFRSHPLEARALTDLLDPDVQGTDVTRR